MSRHTLNDGITPDAKITEDKYHVWLKKLAPPAKLVGDYYKRGLAWEDFEKKYLQCINTPETRQMIKHLAETATKDNITLLCGDHPPEKCHRRLLAEECKRIMPELEVIIN